MIVSTFIKRVVCIESSCVSSFFYFNLFKQALELRENCACPALPPTDPRAVFSETVRVLLEKVKDQEGGELERVHKSEPVLVPIGSPAALVPQTPLLPSLPNVSQLSKNQVSPVDSGPVVAVPVAAVAVKEGSQHTLLSSSHQES